MKTTFFLQLEAEFSRYYKNKVNKVKATRITRNRPSKPIPGAVIVKLTVDVPEQAFLPLEPEAEVSIPLDMVQTVVTVGSEMVEEGDANVD